MNPLEALTAKQLTAATMPPTPATMAVSVRSSGPVRPRTNSLGQVRPKLAQSGQGRAQAVSKARRTLVDDAKRDLIAQARRQLLP